MSNKGVKRGRKTYEQENKEYDMPPQNKKRRTEQGDAGGDMDENDDTGRTSVIIRIQNNTDRMWSEVNWNDIFDADSFDIDRRSPEFEKNGFLIPAGSEDQILVRAKSGAFGVSKGVAGNHTFIDNNNNEFTFKWKMPACGDGKIKWESNDKSLKNAAYYLDKEDGWHVIYFVIKTDGKPNNDIIVADTSLNVFQDVVGFIPIVGDVTNTAIYAGRGMMKEAIVSALGATTGLVGKGISTAAKGAKIAGKAGKVKKWNKAQKGLDLADAAAPVIVNAADGDYKGAVFAGIEKGTMHVMNKAHNKLSSDYTNKQKSKIDYHDTYEFDLNDNGPPIKSSKVGVHNQEAQNKLMKARNIDNLANSASGELVKNAMNSIFIIQPAQIIIDTMIAGSKTMNKTKNFVFKTQFGYITLDKSGWWTITDNKDKATRWNEILYQGIYNQKYFQVASGDWKGYYLGSHWGKGVGVYKKWGDCAYFSYERYRLRCKSGNSYSYSIKYKKATNTFCCYYRKPQYKDCIVIKE